MSRPAKSIGKHTAKPRAFARRMTGRKGGDLDIVKDTDAVRFEDIDWDAAPIEVEIDPRLAERIRSRQLKPVSLRIGEDQIAMAREVAKRTGAKYQAILRRWLANGASLARRRPGSANAKK